MKDVLEFDSLELSFSDKKILSGIYIKCEVGEVVGLLGRNGTGKSSLMKIVFGSLEAEYKSVRINGMALHHNRGEICYLPQDDLIPSYLTVARAFKLFKIDLDYILTAFPSFQPFMNLKRAQLSGGYQRLIEAVMILYAPAKFCILDEPFSGLMPLHVEALIEAIHQAKTTKGILITDHLYRHVTHISDRLYLLNHGKSYPVINKGNLVAMGYLSSYQE